MTMPYGSAEEPAVTQVGLASVPVHVASSDLKPGKALGTEFGRWRTVVVANVIGPYSITPGAARLCNRSLRRRRLRIMVNASVAQGNTAGSGAIAAGGAGSAGLSAGATVTSIDLSFVAATTAAGTATITNTPFGPLVFEIPIGTLALSIPGTYAANLATNQVTVTVAGAVSPSGGTVVLSGVTPAQSATDGVIVGSREEICGGTPAIIGQLGGYLQIGDNLPWECQAELWVCYPQSNGNPVYVSICDEQWASDPDSAKEQG